MAEATSALLEASPQDPRGSERPATYVAHDQRGHEFFVNLSQIENPDSLNDLMIGLSMLRDEATRGMTELAGWVRDQSDPDYDIHKLLDHTLSEYLGVAPDRVISYTQDQIDHLDPDENMVDLLNLLNLSIEGTDEKERKRLQLFAIPAIGILKEAEMRKQARLEPSNNVGDVPWREVATLEVSEETVLEIKLVSEQLEFFSTLSPSDTNPLSYAMATLMVGQMFIEFESLFNEDMENMYYGETTTRLEEETEDNTPLPLHVS